MADNPATAQQMAEQIESQADFARELTALRERAGLRIRDVGRLSGIPVSTVGDYFSGRHLPADRQQLIRILEVCGETDPARMALWEAALQRIRRLPGRRTGTPYRGLARFEQQDARWFFGREEAQRRDFITELCELTGAALVILALRADFYDQAIRYPGLASALESRQV